jgi:hypothetical protein
LCRFRYSVKKVIYNPSFGFRIYTAMETLVAETGNLLHGVHVPKVKPGEGFIEVEIASLNLPPPRYYLRPPQPTLTRSEHRSTTS